VKYEHTRIFRTLADLQSFVSDNLYLYPYRIKYFKCTSNNIGNGNRMIFKLQYTIVKVKKEV
jgi:hypothetical protein